MLFMLIEMMRGWLMPFPFWIRKVGAKGEYLARRDWHRRGYHLVARNWRYKRGEIDAIMANHREVVFIEVKTRRFKPDMKIHEQVRFKQKKRLMSLATHWLKRWHGNVPWRFRVVLVSVRGRQWSLSDAELTLD